MRKAVKSGWNTLGDYTTRYLFSEICMFCYDPVEQKKDSSDLQLSFCTINCYTKYVRQTQRKGKITITNKIIIINEWVCINCIL